MELCTHKASGHTPLVRVGHEDGVGETCCSAGLASCTLPVDCTEGRGESGEGGGGGRAVGSGTEEEEEGEGREKASGRVEVAWPC